MLNRSKALVLFFCSVLVVLVTALTLAEVLSSSSLDVRKAGYDASRSLVVSSPSTLPAASATERGIGATTPDQNQADLVSSGKVKRVIDGDTFVLETEEHIRLIGIDTPEMTGSAASTCYGAEAKQLATELLAEETVQLIFDKDKYDRYGRTLAYVYVGEVFVNEALVASGAAIAKAYPPNTAQQHVFEQAQEIARQKGGGLWSACQ